MTVDFVGLNPKGVNDAAEALRTSCLAWERARDDVQTGILNAPWAGPDADEFRTRLTTTTLPRLSTLCLQITEFATDLDAQVAAQVLASSPFDSAMFGSVTSALGHGIAIAGGANLPRPMGEPLGEPYRSRVHLAVGIAFEGIERTVKALTGDPDLKIRWTTEPSTVVGVSQYEDAATPDNLSDLILLNQEARHHDGAGRDAANIRVTEMRNTETGQSAYVVFIPPTQSDMTDPGAWDGSQKNPRDWASNVGLLAGVKTTAMVDVERAMEEAGVPKGAPVMLVGHSQGGIIASALAADPDFNGAGGYNVTDAFTYGAPVEAFTPAHSGTQVVNVRHEKDLVPFGDLSNGGGTSEQVDDILLEASPNHGAAKGFDPHASHDSVRFIDGKPDANYGYYPTVATQEQASPELVAMRQELDGIYLGENVEIVDDTNVQFVREQTEQPWRLPTIVIPEIDIDTSQIPEFDLPGLPDFPAFP